jgi:PASTA domain
MGRTTAGMLAWLLLVGCTSQASRPPQSPSESFIVCTFSSASPDSPRCSSGGNGLITVPNVRGRPVTTAKRVLRRHGLKVTAMCRVFANDVVVDARPCQPRNGQVVHQRPAAESRVQRHSAIELMVRVETDHL